MITVWHILRGEKARFKCPDENTTGKHLTVVGREGTSKWGASKTKHHYWYGVLGSKALGGDSNHRAEENERDEVVGQNEIELIIHKTKVLAQASSLCIRDIASIQGAKCM